MTRILTDTASDITIRQAAEMGVELVQLSVSFAGACYDATSDEDFSVFYSMLAHEKDLPVTSQPSPNDFLPAFEKAKEAGDEVVAILLSSELSGTVQSANIAKGLCGYDGIYIVDSRQATLGQRLLVEYALQLVKSGLGGAAAAALLENAVPRVRLFAALDTLKYLRKGGRIPKSTELIGSALGIKPIIRLKNGAIETAGKARGHAGAVTAMTRLVEEHPDFDDDCPVYVGYTLERGPGLVFQKLITSRFKKKDVRLYPVGPVIGTHVGPGAFTVVYLKKA